jgi:hypothetical protein
MILVAHCKLPGMDDRIIAKQVSGNRRLNGFYDIF